MKSILSQKSTNNYKSIQKIGKVKGKLKTFLLHISDQPASSLGWAKHSSGRRHHENPLILAHSIPEAMQLCSFYR